MATNTAPRRRTPAEMEVESETMTIDELREYMQRENLNGAEVADLLATHRSTVSNWLNGVRPIPPYMVKLIRATDRLTRVERALAA